MTPTQPAPAADRVLDRVRSRTALLAEVGATMSGSLNVRRSAVRLIGLLQPEFADWVLLGIPDTTGFDLDLYGGATAGAQHRIAASALDASPTLTRMLRSGQTELLHVDASGAQPDGLDELVPHHGLRDEAHRLKPADALGLPLLARGSVIGFLVLVRGEGRGFTVRDVTAAEEVARRAGLSLDLARLYRSRLDTVAAVRAGLRPHQPTLPAGFRCAVGYRPANDETDVAGIFYDVDTVGGDLVLFAGSTAGHTIEAATAALRLRQALRTAARFTRNAGSTVTAALDSLGGDGGCELGFARVRLDESSPVIEATSRGDWLLLLQRCDGELLDLAGATGSWALADGDLLVCTSGLSSATARAAVLELVGRYHGTGAQVLVEAIEQHVAERIPGRPSQDFLAVAVEYRR